MKLFKWIFKFFIGVCGLIFLAYAIGYFLPEKHKASVTQELDLPAVKTWQLITDFEQLPKWRSNIASVKQISPTTWVEINHQNEQIKYEQIEKTDQKRLVTQIASKGLPYSGNWIFTVKPTGDRSILTIEEQGQVYNPLFRFVAKFIIGHKSSINQYIEDLQKI